MMFPAYAELAAAHEEASRRRGDLAVDRVVHIGDAIIAEWDRAAAWDHTYGDPLGVDLAHAALNAIDEWETMSNTPPPAPEEWSALFHLLVNYSSWLDVEDGDLWMHGTHEDLVTAFIATLDPTSPIGRLVIRP